MRTIPGTAARLRRRLLAPAVALVLGAWVLGACGDDAAPAATGGAAGPDAGSTAIDARVVVTTSILGDVVDHLVGDQVEVEVVMPPGADPHEFAPSAQQAAAMREADALIANGLGFEVGLGSTIEAAEADGVPVFEATSAVDTLVFEADDGGGHDDEDHGHDDDGGHEDEDGHDHEGEDPHVFTDPVRMAAIAEGISEFLTEVVEDLDADSLSERTESYLADLRALDTEIEALLAAVPSERRVLITNHDVFAYFADRYDFEVLGVVLPGGTTLAEPSAAEIAALARVVEDHGVPAIFADESARNRLVEALAAEVGHDVAVVELFTESLGPEGSDGDSYLDMMRTNAERIAAALGA